MGFCIDYFILLLQFLSKDPLNIIAMRIYVIFPCFFIKLTNSFSVICFGESSFHLQLKIVLQFNTDLIFNNILLVFEDHIVIQLSFCIKTMSIPMSEKRIINVFKTFIEKVFVPQLSKMDSNSQNDWLKFSNMISGDTFNYGEVQLYVSTLASSVSHLQNSQNLSAQFLDKTRNKSPFNANKPKKQSLNDSVGFNPSKTFGGQRARLMMQMKQVEDNDKRSTFGNPNIKQVRQTIKEGKDSSITTLNFMPTLEKIFKQMSDNQAKFENQPKPVTNNLSNTTTLNFEKKAPFYK